MPGPSNILLIEGTFSELADELAQYLDVVNKVEEGNGIQTDIAPLLQKIRESEHPEQPEQPVDPDSIQKTKDEVLKKIVGNAAVLSTAPEKGFHPLQLLQAELTGYIEFTAAYSLLINLSNQSPMREQFFARVCQYLSERPVTSSAQYGPSLAISTLTTIFNTLPLDSSARYHVFLAIIKVIRSTHSTQAFEALIPQLELNVSNWLSAWQLDDEDARSLYMAIADVAQESGKSALSYQYLLYALETIPPKSASEPESRDLAKRSLSAALTNTTVTDFTPLTASDSIQALRRSDANLFELLEIFSSGDYSEYVDFLETNSLSSLDLPDSAAETLASKIRMLTLASSAASSTTRSVPYSAISSALQIPSSDVEMWVIDTIRAGLVEGKLSQLKQEFLVQRATYRVFGEKQWAEIQGRLMVWRRSLESVLAVVRSEREKFVKEGPGLSYEDEQRLHGGGGGGGGRPNGYAGGRGDRRQGGRGGRGGGGGGDRDRERDRDRGEVDFAGAGE